MRHYSGSLSHPCFGAEEIPIAVTLFNATEGQWKANDQSEEITVMRDGKHILISDKAGLTALEGHEVVGGMLIGVVVQNGVEGGQFRLKPSAKPKTRTVVTRTSVHRRWQVNQVPVIWRSLGSVSLPANMAGPAQGDVSARGRAPARLLN